MSKNTGNIELFDWPKIVKKAMQKREKEGLTQKAHAALARVSIPTMISFERAETTLSISKVLDILEVVSMVAQSKAADDSFQAFAEESNNRWLELTKTLSEDSYAKHNNGYYALAFSIIGDLEKCNMQQLLKHMKEAAVSYSHRTTFWIPQKNEEIVPYITNDNYIECWTHNVKHPSKAELYDDFWRASPKGKFYLHRRYQEDSTEVLEPAKIFDLFLPIIAVVEIICYASKLANFLALNKLVLNKNETTIELLVQYTGLKGRRLFPWSNPMINFYENKICLQDIVESSITFNLSEIKDLLPENIGRMTYELLKNVYNRFGFYELSYNLVQDYVNKLILKKL